MIRTTLLVLVAAGQIGGVACSGSVSQVEPGDGDSGDGDSGDGDSGDGDSGDGDSGDGDSGDGDSGDGDAGDGDGDGNLGADWMTLHACEDGDPRDPIDVVDARIDGNEIVIDVAHSGGCGEHAYGLCYSEAWTEGIPVGTELTVLHFGSGDPCEAYLHETVRFDLTAIEEQYEVYYQSSTGTVALGIGGTSLQYSFGPAPSWDEIYTAISELNTCETHDDCTSIATMPCEQRFLNAHADTTNLERDIQRRLAADGSLDYACDANCLCAVLSCSDAGSCVAAESPDCMDPEEGQSICL